MKKKIVSQPNLGNMMLLDEVGNVSLVPIDNAPNVFNPRFSDIIKENFYAHFTSDKDFRITAECIATGLDEKLKSRELRLDKRRISSNLRVGLLKSLEKIRTLGEFRLPLERGIFSELHAKQLEDFLREVIIELPS